MEMIGLPKSEYVLLIVFFFQAEDGIRDLTVTGVQTCALPISVRALRESVRYNVNVVSQTLAVLGKIVRRELAAKSALSGPLEIAALSGAAARSGFKNLLYLMGFISISIAVLNLLPVPILDGGQIAVLLVEGLMRRDLSVRFKERINQVGFVLLVALMVMVLYFDVVKSWPMGDR